MFAALLTRSSRYDLVHLNCLVYSHVAYGYLAAHWRNVPIVVTPHVHAAQQVTYGIGYQLSILGGSDHVIADTAGERAFLLTLGLEPSKVSTVGVGVRPERYPVRDRDACRRRLELPPDAFVLLFLGRQVEYKGIENALQAVVTLQERFPHVHIVVAGPETGYSRRLFARYRGRPGVTNLGVVSDTERLDALNACDCLVLPSTGEAFGLVFLEAWIVGKPVIGARTAAVSEIISDGLDGWIVPPGDPSALAETIVRWIESPDLARQMGQVGRQKVLADYTCARVADVVEGIYARTLSRPPQH
jgi:glycosyltransferase involved in cell wall biosynthesis